METTRHFVTSVFIVNEGKTALHEHKKLGMMLPPGGHIDRDELPHKAAEREVYEETGLEVNIKGRNQDLGEFKWSSEIPAPQYLALDDVTVMDEEPVHQHINMVYFAQSDRKSIEPKGKNEVSSDKWYWINCDDIQGDNSLPLEIDNMTRNLVSEAIESFR